MLRYELGGRVFSLIKGGGKKPSTLPVLFLAAFSVFRGQSTFPRSQTLRGNALALQTPFAPARCETEFRGQVRSQVQLGNEENSNERMEESIETERCSRGAQSPRRMHLLLRRGLFFRLALQERDLLDPRGIGRTPSGDIGIVLECVMHDSPFVGIHRLELE